MKCKKILSKQYNWFASSFRWLTNIVKFYRFDAIKSFNHPKRQERERKETKKPSSKWNAQWSRRHKWTMKDSNSEQIKRWNTRHEKCLIIFFILILHHSPFTIKWNKKHYFFILCSVFKIIIYSSSFVLISIHFILTIVPISKFLLFSSYSFYFLPHGTILSHLDLRDFIIVVFHTHSLNSRKKKMKSHSSQTERLFLFLFKTIRFQYDGCVLVLCYAQCTTRFITDRWRKNTEMSIYLFPTSHCYQIPTENQVEWEN